MTSLIRNSDRIRSDCEQSNRVLDTARDVTTIIELLQKVSQCRGPNDIFRKNNCSFISYRNTFLIIHYFQSISQKE